MDPGIGRETVVKRASRLLLPNAFDPCADRALSRGGQEKLRTHVTVRRSRQFVDTGRYNDLNAFEKGEIDFGRNPAVRFR